MVNATFVFIITIERYYKDRCGGCLNGGNCICNKYGKYFCKCKSGYSGKRCSGKLKLSFYRISTKPIVFLSQYNV